MYYAVFWCWTTFLPNHYQTIISFGSRVKSMLKVMDGWWIQTTPSWKLTTFSENRWLDSMSHFLATKVLSFKGEHMFVHFYSGGKNAFTHWWSLIMIWCTQTNKHIHWPRFQVEQFVIEIDKLNAIITSIEKEMVSLPGIYRGEGVSKNGRRCPNLPILLVPTVNCWWFRDPARKTTSDGAKTRPVNNGRYIRLPYQQGEFTGFSFTINPYDFP